VFTGLLFLSAQAKVELVQSDFYGQIQVHPYFAEKSSQINLEIIL
jgi:chromatin segregation and condensation protein Rec8/ScpA/Scc1 (kleisin family)